MGPKKSLLSGIGTGYFEGHLQRFLKSAVAAGKEYYCDGLH